MLLKNENILSQFPEGETEAPGGPDDCPGCPAQRLSTGMFLPARCWGCVSDGSPCFLLWKHTAFSNTPLLLLPLWGLLCPDPQSMSPRPCPPGAESQVGRQTHNFCQTTPVWASTLLSSLLVADIVEDFSFSSENPFFSQYLLPSCSNLSHGSVSRSQLWEKVGF